jgi:hypothetical protein
MVKRIKTHFVKEEDLSDLEIDDQELLAEEKECINDRDILNEKKTKIQEEFVKGLKLNSGEKNVNWLETMDIISKEEVDETLNPDDDIKRELIFYNLTLGNVVKGINKLKEVIIS